MKKWAKYTIYTLLILFASVFIGSRFFMIIGSICFMLYILYLVIKDLKGFWRDLNDDNYDDENDDDLTL